MIVVHGWWPVDGGHLVLWAEDSTAAPEPPRRPGRRPRVLDHPFTLPAEDLAKRLDLPSRGPGSGQTGTAVLILPTRGRGPMASPELVRTDRVGEEPVPIRSGPSTPPVVTAAAWRVPTVSADADTALVLLRSVFGEASAPGPTDLGSPEDETDLLLPGAELRYLRALAAFAADLTSRGRVLPTVQPAGTGRGSATWRPVVSGADAAWLRTAATAMPVCLAATGADPVAPTALVAAAVDAMVDASVRVALDAGPRRRGPARSWRDALVGTDRSFPAPGDQVLELQQELAQWEQEAVRAGAVRACFRLVEPDGQSPPAPIAHPGGPWRLDLALQSVDEPSLVVDAEQVWTASGPLRALARHVPDPQETLLAELGRAVRLYPALEGALRTARPAVLELDTTGAYAFLVEAAPMLVAAGFGVLLPGWWTSPTARLGARLHVRSPAQPGAATGQARIGQEGLVDFRWELAVGEHVLTAQEVTDLVAAAQPLVRVRGQWMQVDPERLVRARAFLDRRGRRGAGQMSVGDVLRALGSPDQGPGELPVVDVAAEGWMADLLSGQAERRLEPVGAPAGFVGTLRPYQERGLAWMSFLETIGMGALLADDMGLGKTIQLLALIARDVESAPTGASVDPTLLVAPMSMVGTWQREAARFTPGLRVHVHHGAERPRGKAFDAAVAGADLVVTTYALLVRDAAALRGRSWRRVVLDEAQAVKNAATKVAVAARSIHASRRIAVTGTPVENRLADLWSLMEFANPRLLGAPAAFKKTFATPIERHGDEQAAARLRALTQPFLLRRVKTDSSIIADLPEKLEMEVVASLTAEQASLYQAVVEDMLERIETTTGIERRGLVLATMTKLKQVCNHPAQFHHDGSRVAGRSGKLALLEEILTEVLAAGEKVLLFTQFAEFGSMLRAHLAARFGTEVAFLHGGVAKSDRDAMVARFQGEGGTGPSVFVLSLKAGGTGLTLTAANHVVHVDRWWNPAVEDQATDRAHRIGQSRTVQVRKLVCAGTLEEKISTMISEKRGLAESIVGTGEGWLTELSTTALRELFTLEAGAVVE